MMKEEEAFETNPIRIKPLIKAFNYSYLRYIDRFLNA
jgi:hypothetical protein